MSESTSMREAIAKLLHADGQGVEWDTEYPSMKRRYLGLASEILEVLADPPADVFERALDMFRNRVLKCRCSLCESIAEERVKDTFAAVFGGESS